MKGGMKMKTQIKIKSHEDKTSKEGKDYTRFNTSQGWVSAFDSEIIEELKKGEGRTVSVELATSEDGKFKNIRKFYGLVAPGLEELKQANKETEELIAEVIKPNSMGRSAYNPTSMYVSYAKDIFCASLKDNAAPLTIEQSKMLMNAAVELVKQAHKAFE